MILLAVGIVIKILPQLVEDPPRGLMFLTVLGPVACSALVIVWWVAASRARWQERLFGFIGYIGAAGLTLLLMDASMRGPAVMLLTAPMGGAAFILGAIACARMLSFRRTVIATLLAACGFGFSTALRSDGMWGDFSLGLHWRWEPTPEERMLANKPAEAATPENVPLIAVVDPEWPAFRGADRAGHVSGAGIARDWDARPPEELWRINVGPAWSSFAVAGSLLFTQEQRGPMETVVCYDAETGSEIWTQQVEARFSDPLGGPGPRATPTLAADRLYAMGADGVLLCLEAVTGDIVWQKSLRDVADREPPMWGFSSSPLVTGDVVIVHAGGEADKGTLGFDANTGDVRWSAPAGDHSYCSPHPAEIDGRLTVLMLTNTGLDILDPETGTVLLAYEWPYEGYRSVQPQLVDGNSILLPTGTGTGTRRIRVTATDGTLSAEETWTSRQLKPDFNDYVIHNGVVYGYDDAVFTCVDLETGERVWKGGRYGKGQVLLLDDPGLLLVISETGELVLLEANSEALMELARFQAIEGKTWNHPVLVGNRLYVRNAEEAACYLLPSE